MRTIMQKSVTFVVALAAIRVLSAAPALATPINPINSGRPVAPVLVGDGPTSVSQVGGTPAGDSNVGMQLILDHIYGCLDCVDQISGQSVAGMWSLPGFDPQSTILTLQFEFTSDHASDVFGIWSGTDSTAITFAPIFNGSTTFGGPIGDTATLKWIDPNDLSVNGAPAVHINQAGFGFYLCDTSIVPTCDDPNNFLFSVDSLNEGGTAHMLAYVDSTTDEWVFGFGETLSAPPDFNDTVVSVQSIKPVAEPVPEPGSIVLFGTGLAGVIRRARHRRAAR